MIDIDTVVEEANRLAPLPRTASRLAAILGQESIDAKEITKVVSFDQALTVRILRISNSAIWAGRDPITSVKDAVVRLGSGMILSVAVAGTAQKLLTGAVPQYGLDEGALWEHSITSALAGNLLRIHCGGVVVPPETFTVALLHDIGKLVLGRFLTAEILQFLSDSRRIGDLSAARAELEILGTNHAEIGAIVAQHWELPEIIAHGIRQHHTPDDAQQRLRSAPLGVLVDAVHVADYVANSIGAGRKEEDPEPKVEASSLSRLGLGNGALANIKDKAISNVEDLLASYG